MSYTTAYVLLGALWVAACTGAGALLALLAKRLHPALSFRRLWVFYSTLMALAGAAIIALVIV
jgi:hypothetical protein